MTIEAPAPVPALYSAPPDGQTSSKGKAPRPSSIRAPARHPPASPAAPRQAATADGGRRPRKGGRRGGGSTRGTSTGLGGGQGWPSFCNAWTGTISMWSGQAPSGPRPPALAILTVSPYGAPQTPAYDIPPYGVPPITQAPPQLPPPGTPTTTPWPSLAGGWDPASLAAAYSTMALAPPSSD
jgi:hypothetical protein